MADYRLTRRGKFAIGVLIIVQLFIVGKSGVFILNYFNNINPGIPLVSETTSEMEPITEASSEPTHDTTIETSTEGTIGVENSDQIYNAEELSDLKQFHVIFYFDENEVSTELDVADLESIIDMFKTYPDEEITVSGHVNGYPNFSNSNDALELSERRATFVIDELVNLGVDINLISVYNQGSEMPLFKDYGNQNKNNRVEVYFSDHFIVTNSGK